MAPLALGLSAYGDDDGQALPSPETMAVRLGSYPPGTGTWVYTTSDGGLSLDNAFNELVPILPSHVLLVSADAVRIEFRPRAPAQHRRIG